MKTVGMKVVLAEQLDTGRAASWLVFPTVGIIPGLILTFLILGGWSRNFMRAVTSREALLFFTLFATFGAICGSAFIIVHTHAWSKTPLKPTSGADAKEWDGATTAKSSALVTCGDDQSSDVSAA